MDEQDAINSSGQSDVGDEALLSQRLREAREYLGLSQEVVAEHLGIPRAAVSAIETGKRKVSSLELKQLAKLYRREYNFFLESVSSGSEGEAPEGMDRALFRATKELTDRDREQVLRFAEFLLHAGSPPNSVTEGNQQ